ncbi:MAG: glycosyltransferase [Bacteroidales bacterium]|nr:glycosyltransferase [Bacteroidales bacterium]
MNATKQWPSLTKSANSFDLHNQRQPGLRKTIESTVSQTFNDFEHNIIDGGSTDGSVEVIKEYADKMT